MPANVGIRRLRILRLSQLANVVHFFKCVTFQQTNLPVVAQPQLKGYGTKRPVAIAKGRLRASDSRPWVHIFNRTVPRTPTRTVGHKSTTLVTTCDPDAVV